MKSMLEQIQELVELSKSAKFMGEAFANSNVVYSRINTKEIIKLQKKILKLSDITGVLEINEVGRIHLSYEKFREFINNPNLESLDVEDRPDSKFIYYHYEAVVDGIKFSAVNMEFKNEKEQALE